MTETHWKKLTNPDYVGSWDFEKNEERTLTIQNVKQESVYNPSSKKEEMCTVAYFYEPCKPMILNKTNCKMITALYNTPFIEQWTGLKIVVGVDKVKAKGELVEALRIRNKKPVPAAPVSEPKPIVCADCNNPISGVDRFTAAQIAAGTLKKYGVEICSDCAVIRKK